MRWSLTAILASGVLCGLAGRTWAEPPADVRAILDRAITVTGGADNLAALKTISGSGTGTYHGGWLPLGCDVSGAIQFPDRKRMELDFGVDGWKVPYIQVLAGDQGWVKLRGKTTAMNAEQLALAQADMYVNQLMNLVPLRDPAFHLTSLGESLVNGWTVQGIRVRREGRPEVSLYFDEDNGLLRKATVTVSDKLTQEYFFGKYQNFQGVQRATRQDVRQNGKAFLEITFTDVRINQPVGADAFAKP